MSKRDAPARLKLSDFKERKELEGAVDVEMDDGQVFRIPPPELWPDAVGKVGDGDIEEVGRLILGAETFDSFVAAGGTGMLLQAIVDDHHGAKPGE